MKIIQRTNGISPVLTVLLLISVAVGTALITQIWLINYVDNTMSKVEHVIWIPSVDFMDNGGTIELTIYVQNIHDGVVQVTTVFVNSAMVSENDISISESGFIKESETCTINVTNQSIEREEDISIKVVCIDGVSTEGKFKVVIE